MPAVIFLIGIVVAIVLYFFASRKSGPTIGIGSVDSPQNRSEQQQGTPRKEIEQVVRVAPGLDPVAGSCAKGRAQPKLGNPTVLLAGFPETIAFIDTETTGLHSRDRIVTLAVVLLNTEDIRNGRANLSYMHRIYNPGIQCHPDAERIHGHQDWTLRHQPFFVEEAQEVSLFILKAGMVCCHNAAFDLEFLNREFQHAALPPINVPSYCTMKRYRQEFSGSASLNNLIAHLGLKRSGGKHGALEDVFLTINIFLALNGVPCRVPLASIEGDLSRFQNIRHVPQMPSGALPPRKRRPKTKPSV